MKDVGVVREISDYQGWVDSLSGSFEDKETDGIKNMIKRDGR